MAKTETDPRKALQLLELSAASECREGMRELGMIYERGTNGEGQKVVEVDLDRAHELYLKAAELGDSLAKNYLGSFYYNHTHEYEKAVNCFRQASECDRALNNLGLCFEQGLGKTVQDYNQAIKLYELSAD